jgi:O-antigen biosynthesis protein WbqP
MALPRASVGGYAMPEISEDDKVSRLKRIFDCVFASILLVGLAPLFVLVAIAIKLTSKGSILFWSDRVGRNNKLFRMPKFRTMRMDTPQLATHLLSDPSAYLTPIGKFLRETSIDELPQLFSILAGHLSLVGPRPALFNQKDLVDLRTRRGVHRLMPGITGWAQVNGRDELSIPIKVNFDCEYLRKRSFGFDLRILAMTARKVVRREGVSH